MYRNPAIRFRISHTMAITILVAAWTTASHGAMTNLSCVADTFIINSAPNNNAGGDSGNTAGRDNALGVRRAFFRFDLTGIPAGSTVSSAELQLSVTKVPPLRVDSAFEIHRLLAAWGEGAKTSSFPGNNGAAASANESTWNSRLHGTAAWTAPGALDDVAATASASTPVVGLGLYSWTGVDVMGDVQSWVDHPSSNYGWMVKSDNEATAKTVRDLGSRESVNVPVLVVGYTLPSPPPPVDILSIAAPNDVVLTWKADARQRYDVEFHSDLTSTTGWRLAETDIPAVTGGTNVWQDAPYLASPAYAPNSRLFYRVRALDAAGPGLPIAFDVVASNLTSPTVLTHAGDGSGRIFVAEQTGQILIVDSNQTLLPVPFMDLSDKMTNLTVFTAFGNTNAGLNPFYDERGLLGLAFHPTYASNGRFFVYYSSPKTAPGVNHESILAEYSVSTTNPNLANAASERVLLRVDEPEFNHNGGSLVFGPSDGYLYVALGDGGGGGDVHGAYGNGQNITNLLGSILRLDVDSASPYAIPTNNPFVGTNGADEIYAYGFRNPWKMSFDRGGSNALVVADVGQNLWEEIDFVRKGGNYGWRIMEGRHAFDPAVAATVGADIASLDYPIHEYKHGPLGISIIGGFVYRGTNYPNLAGSYVFGDFSSAILARPSECRTGRYTI